MSEAADLGRDELHRLLPGRPLRTYPAMLSTEAEAMAWARTGAPHGAVVVTGYQAAPRGRAGLSWEKLNEPGHGLGFSLVLRMDLDEAHEGWMYAPTLVGMLDALEDSSDLALEWPDRVVRGEETAAAVGVQSEAVGGRLQWGVVSVFVPGAEPPRARLFANAVESIEARLGQPVDDLRAAYRARCATFGRRVVARLLPLGPAAPAYVGVATDLAADGGMVITEQGGARVVVDATVLGFVEDPEVAPRGPEGRS